MCRQGRVENVAMYIVLGVDLEGHRDVLGHLLGDGAEGANVWLSVVTDLQARGFEDIFIIKFWENNSRGRVGDDAGIRSSACGGCGDSERLST